MAELADAADSRSAIRKGVRVQVPLPIPNDPMAEWFMRSSAKAVMLVRFQLGSHPLISCLLVYYRVIRTHTSELTRRQPCR